MRRRHRAPHSELGRCPARRRRAAPAGKVKAPYPLVVFLHGFSGSKDDVTADITGLARDGYAVLSYSARGFGNSCGAPASRGDAACVRGWSHLADVRYEPRDTQYLAGLLADAGVIDGRRVGVTGTSYGAGQSLILATLRDRTVLPDYRVVRWRSPKGAVMRIAAAAPNWAWSRPRLDAGPEWARAGLQRGQRLRQDDRHAKGLLRRAAVRGRDGARLLRTARRRVRG